MRTAEGVHPPTKGYAAQYERLLMEELSLKQDRQAFLHQSSSGGCDDTANDKNSKDDHDAQQSLLKIRGMLHRTSLQGMLLSAQHAADEALNNNNKSNITMSDNNGNASSMNNNNYERGLDCPDAKNALVALLNVKSRQLEEEDNEIPLGIGSESLAWRQSFTSSIIGQEGATKLRGEGEGLEVEASSADDFFCNFPECKRRIREDELSCYSEMDEDESDSDEDEIIIVDNQQQQKKQKQGAKQKQVKNGQQQQPSVVTSCSSSSPSPEKVQQQNTTTLGNESNVHLRGNTDMQNHQYQNQPAHAQQNQKQPLPISNSNPYQQHHAQQHYSSSNNYTNNPYQRQQQNNHWQNNNQHKQQNPYQHHHEVVASSAFDYNDSNSLQGSAACKEPESKKSNPFRTAKELGPNFNDKKSRGNGGHNNNNNGRGRGSGGNDDNWDSYGNTGNLYNNNNNNQRRGINSGPGGPQQMVRAAIRGPKDNISAGLKRKFQPPIKRDGNNSGGGGQNSGGNNNNYKSSNNNNNSKGTNNNDDDELPEELRGLDKELNEKINNDIVDSGEQVTFKDIA